MFKELKKINARIEENQQAIREYNASRLLKTLFTAAILITCPILIGAFHQSMRVAFPGYISALVGVVLLYVVFYRERMKKYALLGWYLLAVVMFLLALYLSVDCSPNRPAGTMLTVLCIFPFLFVEKPLHLTISLFVLYFVQSWCSCTIKGWELGKIDMLNGFISVAIGLLVGNSLIKAHLDNFEAQHQLVLEKTTDVLTGVGNRRKLFEMLGAIKIHKAARATCVFMIDIDNFKEFNDTYGHVAGDDCLRMFGTLLLNLERKYDVKIYRYGGEEFVAMLWRYDRDEMLKIAEEIRMRVQALSVDDKRITASIGTVYCDTPDITNYETWIDRADRALYVSKAQGRNRVVCWNDLEQKKMLKRVSVGE